MIFAKNKKEAKFFNSQNSFLSYECRDRVVYPKNDLRQKIWALKEISKNEPRFEKIIGQCIRYFKRGEDINFDNPLFIELFNARFLDYRIRSVIEDLKKIKTVSKP